MNTASSVISERSQDGSLQGREDLVLIKAKVSALKALHVLMRVNVSLKCTFWYPRDKASHGAASSAHPRQTSEAQSLCRSTNLAE